MRVLYNYFRRFVYKCETARYRFLIFKSESRDFLVRGALPSFWIKRVAASLHLKIKCNSCFFLQFFRINFQTVCSLIRAGDLYIQFQKNSFYIFFEQIIILTVSGSLVI